MHFLAQMRAEVVALLAKPTGLPQNEIDRLLEKPPESVEADLAFPCFVLAKRERKNPVQIAKEIAGTIKPAGLVKAVTAAGPYVNFSVDNQKLGRLVINAILKEKDTYGSTGEKGSVLLEFCQANTHKTLHIGHVRNMAIGEALARILEHRGHDVKRVNYQGDIGPHVAKCLWGLRNLDLKPGPNKGVWVGEVYAAASKKVKEDPQVEQEVRQINQRLYAGDQEIITLWKESREWSLDYYDTVYKDFGIVWDRLYFESGTEKAGMPIARELLKKGIAQNSEGAIIVDLKKYNLGVVVLITQADTPLYHAKDLGLAQLKVREYPHIDRSIHVVGSEQKMYFQQLFKIFELMKSPLAGKSYHLSYELVNLASGKMSSREGTVVTYDQLYSEVYRHALELTTKKNPGLGAKEREEIARSIAMGAIKYSMINQSPDKTITFDWQQALSLQGNSAPYLQYSYTRASSILAKATKIGKGDAALLIEEKEIALVKLLAEFPDVIVAAAKDYRPHYLATYLHKLATSFNDFYESVPVLKAEGTLRNARLSLVKSVMVVLSTGLHLLGIDAPEKM